MLCVKAVFNINVLVFVHKSHVSVSEMHQIAKKAAIGVSDVEFQDTKKVNEIGKLADELRPKHYGAKGIGSWT